jgi:hypothetical protein
MYQWFMKECMAKLTQRLVCIVVYGEFKICGLYLLNETWELGWKLFVVSDKRLAIRLLENLYPIISKSCKIVVIILGRTNWVASQTYECARYSSKYANQFHLNVYFKSIILHFVKKKNQLYYLLWYYILAVLCHLQRLVIIAVYS